MIAPPDFPVSRSIETDSDSDWDDDDDFGIKKINIKIKPIAQVTPSKISASVDELRATVETWKSMANINLVKPNSRRNHHLSTLQLDGTDKMDHLNNRRSLLEPSISSTTLLSKDLTGVSGTLANSDVPVPSPVLRPTGSQGSLHLPVKNSHFDDNSSPAHELFSSSNADQFFQSSNCFDSNSTNGQRLRIQSINDLIQTNTCELINPDPNNCLLDQLSKRSDISSTKLPVAVAIQESISARMVAELGSQQSCPISIRLHGKLKMAVPKSFVSMALNHQQESMILELLANHNFEKVNYNQSLCKEVLNEQDQRNKIILPESKKFRVDMKAVLEYARNPNNQRLSSLSYLLLPDLLSYSIGIEKAKNSTIEMNCINPLIVFQNLLCTHDNVIKFRLDLKINPESDLEPELIQNVKIRLTFDNVKSCESKPMASWNTEESIMEWSFDSLAHLVNLSKAPNDIGTCLARFHLDTKPLSFKDLDIRFNIPGRTLSGSKISLRNLDHYHICKQKLETRVSSYKCEISDSTPLLSSNSLI